MRSHLLHFRPDAPHLSYFYPMAMSAAEISALQARRHGNRGKGRGKGGKKDPPGGGGSAGGSGKTPSGQSSKSTNNSGSRNTPEKGQHDSSTSSSGSRTRQMHLRTTGGIAVSLAFWSQINILPMGVLDQELRWAHLRKQRAVLVHDCCAGHGVIDRHRAVVLHTHRHASRASSRCRTVYGWILTLLSPLACL